MAEPRLEEVFRISGVPTHTFVEPSEYRALRVALRSPGRGVVLEGPSGIGKSTAATRALEAEGLAANVQLLSSRVPKDVDVIRVLPDIDEFGTAILEDFHVLDDQLQAQLADLLKTLADRGSRASKLVIVGIPRAGESLIKHAPDLANRIDTIRLAVEPNEKVAELISLGERALNIRFKDPGRIVEAARGSFYLAQMLCFELCVADGVLDRPDAEIVAGASFAETMQRVLRRQEARFGEVARKFARGTRFRPSGRAPYFHVLRWLADSQQWDISLEDEMARHPNERASVSQVVDKGYLENLVADPEIARVLHYDANLRSLSVEDPHMIFYLRNVDWDEFARRAGFTRPSADQPYDFALSFAGEDREFARALAKALEELDCSVFLDENEEERILAEDLERFLAPIYKSQSEFVIVVLGPKYGEKRWTIFESQQFKERFGEGRVIPIWSTKAPPSAFDKTAGVGGKRFDPDGDLAAQVEAIARVCEKKLRSIGAEV